MYEVFFFNIYITVTCISACASIRQRVLNYQELSKARLKCNKLRIHVTIGVPIYTHVRSYVCVLKPAVSDIKFLIADLMHRTGNL